MKLSFGLYTKSLLMWLAVFAVVGGSFLVIRGRGAKTTAFDFPARASAPGIFEGTVVLDRSGKATFQGKDVTSSLKPRRDFDELQLKVLDESGIGFGTATVMVLLPFSVDEPSLKTNAFLIHSFDSSVSVTKQPPSTITFTAANVSSEAVLTIRLEFKKGLLNLPLAKRIANFFINAPLGFWIVASLILPIITLLYMLYLLASQASGSKRFSPGRSSSRPSQDLPPAVVGLLKRGSVSARDIAATLVDLATRGWIDIFYREGHFTFGKRKPFHFYTLEEVTTLPDQGASKTKGLRRYEEVLLSKILPPEGYRATDQDIVVRVGHRLFSPKMADVFMEVYHHATALGFFMKDPALVHRTIRRRGITLFAIGLAGFFVSALALPEPKFLLIFWIGMVGASLLIVELGNLVSFRTAEGQRALDNWLAFEHYLADSSPIAYREITAGVFGQYLPYAIALGVEGAWIARFRRHPFAPPSWFGSTTTNLTLEQFDRELFPILSWVASSLVAAKEPTVE